MVIDEAQDLSPMQARALGRRCAGGSLTILGDIAQSTAPGAVASWQSLRNHLGSPDARLEVLGHGYRVPAEILDYAARLLPAIAPDLTPPISIRRTRDALTVTKADHSDLPAAIVRACREHLVGDGSVGIITADHDIPALHHLLTAAGLNTGVVGDVEDETQPTQLTCVPASLAKGLEFDAVILIEPSRIVDAEQRGLQRLYVCLTRAVSSLHVIHTDPLPHLLHPH